MSTPQSPRPPTLLQECHALLDVAAKLPYSQKRLLAVRSAILMALSYKSDRAKRLTNHKVEEVD